MKSTIIILSTLLVTAHAAIGSTFLVPGTADPWLAGMPNGSTASMGDSAPAHSPVLVTGISITGGAKYSFLNVSGSVNRGVETPMSGPDGIGTASSDMASHWISMLQPGAQNGIANITVPANALVGVFLGPNQPSLSTTPPSLDFSTAGALNYLTLSPGLQQPFFIGDGLTSLGQVQQVIAPSGATRLFLGMMDNYGWYNNQGSFTGEIQVVPEPKLSIRLSHVELCWDTVTNTVYQLEYRSDLTTNSWQPLGGWISGDGFRFCTNDAILPGEPQRFYQLVATNAPLAP